MADSEVIIIPRQFNAPPFVCAATLCLCQLGLAALTLLQLIRGYAWWPNLTPLAFMIIVASYTGLCGLFLFVNFVYIFGHLGRTQDRRLERHYHPNLSATSYINNSLMTAVPACVMFVYYYIHYSGVSPVARSTGDQYAALERLVIWGLASLYLEVICVMFVSNFLQSVIVPSILTMRYQIQTKLTPVAADETTALLKR